MAKKKKQSRPDITSAARMLQAGRDPKEPRRWIWIDFALDDFDPPGTSIGLRLTLEEGRKLVHTALDVLAKAGDYGAQVLLKVIEQMIEEDEAADRREGNGEAGGQ